MNEYPHGVDAVWVAANADGQVAAFVTAGEGPVPKALVEAMDLSAGDVERALMALPVVTDVRLEMTYPNMSSFIEMAKRGFIVYDWSDVHRATKDRLKTYERAVVPLSPILLRQCEGRIGDILRITPVIPGAFGRLILPGPPVTWPSPFNG